MPIIEQTEPSQVAPNQDVQVVILNVSILPWQRNVIDEYRQRHSFLSTSQAVRSILSEWWEENIDEYQENARDKK